MSPSKTIKIFLASSITELDKERKNISDSISQDLTHLFEKDDIIIQFLRCDSIHSGNIGKPDQDRIDEMLRKCDVSLFLFKDREGEYTLHEYDVARNVQKEKKHEIYVYYLPCTDGKKSEGLTPFQERMKADGLFWKESNNLMEMKYDFAMGLLKHLGVQLGESIQSSEEVKKDGDALFKQLEQNKLQMHQEIEKLLAQVDPIMEDEDSSIAAKITQVIGIYQKADLWASKTDYEKKKYSDLLFNYAQFLYEYGLYQDSEAVWLRQIPLVEELYGTEHEETATSYNKIGVVYTEKSSYNQALLFLQKACDIRENVLGSKHASTAISYNNIGEVYREKGEYDRAREYYMKALGIWENVLGSEHIYTAISLNNIGEVSRERGDYDQALEYYLKALMIQKKVSGIEHPDIARLYNNIALVYEEKGNYNQALKYHKKSCEIFENVLGTKHNSTATSYNNIGVIYQKKGDYPKALEYNFKALEIRESVLGADHPDTATSYNNIGAIYFFTEEYNKALEYLNKALDILETKLGQGHPKTQVTRRWINDVQAVMKKGN